MAKKKKNTTIPAPVTLADAASNVIPTNMHDYLRKRNLAYMIYTNTDRAIPLVTSGIKPGAQRLLVSMFRDGVLPGTKPRKSAKLTTAATGSYHPHGQSSMYGSLVSMAVPYARIQLIEGIGSFGSVPGDDPAADRYTEARLSPLGYELVKDIDKGAVPMRPTYDKETTEPWFLPATFPVLLCYGAMGIGEGWATSTPAHNPREVMKAVEVVLDNPDASVDDILEVMPGPDWGTGANIIGDISGIKEYFETGRGAVTVRCDYEIDGKEINITSVPPGVNVPTLLNGSKGKDSRPGLKDMVRQNVIQGIADVSDYSDYDVGLLITVTVKRGYNPEEVVQEILANTDLETTYAASIVALDDNLAPRWWSVRELIDSFISMRDSVIINRSQFELDSLLTKLERQRALAAVALDKEIVARVILDAENKAQASEHLQLRKFVIPREHAHLFEAEDNFIRLGEEQCDYIVGMPMYRLTKADSLEAMAKLQELIKRRDELEKLIKSKAARKKVIRKELKETAKLFDDPKYDRLTRIREDIKPTTNKDSAPDDERMYASWKLDTELMMLGDSGESIPEGTSVWSAFVDGKIKIFQGGNLPLSVKAKPVAPKIDELHSCGIVDIDKDSIIFITQGNNKSSIAKALRLAPGDLPVQGIGGNGVAGIKLLEGDKVVGVCVAREDESILLVSESAYKIIPVSDIPVKGRGTQGVGVFRLAKKDAGVLAAYSGQGFSINGAAGKSGSTTSAPVRKVVETWETT